LSVRPSRAVVKEGPADQFPVSRTSTIVVLIYFCILTLSEPNNIKGGTRGQIVSITLK